MGANDFVQIVALDRERNVRIFSKRRDRGVNPRFPARRVAAALLALRNELGIQPDRDVVDEKAFIDAGGVDLTGRARERDVESRAPVERNAEVAREVIERTEWEYAEKGFGVHQRLNDVADRAVAAGGDEEIPSLRHLLPNTRRAIEAAVDVKDIEVRLFCGSLDC